MDKGNLAARAGRWSAAHWKTATFAWIAFVIASVAIGSAVGVVKLSDAENATGEASRAQAILQSAGFSQPADENVLVQSKTLTVADPAFRATIDRVAAKLRTLPQVQEVRSPLTPAAAKAVSPDRHAALVQFSIRGKADTRRQADPAGDGQRRDAAEAEPGLHRRRVRLREREPRAEQHDRQGLPEGGAADRSDHVPDPALRVRRVRRRRHPGAARVHRRARVDRARRGRPATSPTRPTRPTR